MYDDLLALAVDVAEEAADLVRTRRRAGVEVSGTKSSPVDVVTEVDKASERLIFERLMEARPGDGFLGEEGVGGVVVVPIGFVSDHMEVIYDLDTEASATAEKAGMSFARAATAGVDPRFVAMLRDLLVERDGVERGAEPVRATVGGQVASWDVCAAGCCANPRGTRPALCGRD